MALFPLQLAGNSLLVEQSSYEGGKTIDSKTETTPLIQHPGALTRHREKGHLLLLEGRDYGLCLRTVS